MLAFSVYCLSCMVAGLGVKVYVLWLGAQGSGPVFRVMGLRSRA